MELASGGRVLLGERRAGDPPLPSELEDALREWAAFADAFGLLWMPANVLVALGLAPSLHLLRHVPFWRWPAMGAAVGLGVAWVVLLLGLLG